MVDCFYRIETMVFLEFMNEVIFFRPKDVWLPRSVFYIVDEDQVLLDSLFLVESPEVEMEEIPVLSCDCLP